MSFCSFSKDFDGNAHVTVANKFITKYLPEADGFAVKVYLYGLYLCQNTTGDFSLASMAEVLRSTQEKIADAFTFWEDYDLVQIVSRSPFAVQYLPVQSTSGRPKKIKYEQYADFNKELQRKMQRVGKFIGAGEYLKYMRFMEETSIQPQALLLVAEYCINKQGENVAPAYIFNKARKLLQDGNETYEQVERALSGYNSNERDLTQILTLLGSYRKTPDESDFSCYRKWTETLGFSKEGILETAKRMKRGSMQTLELTLEDLYERGLKEPEEIGAFLTEREVLTALTLRIGKKLGVKVSNPAPYIDEYVEKWTAYGFEDTSLWDIALFCLKTDRGNFESMHTVVEKLYKNGVVTKDGVKSLLKEKNDDLKLFAKIQEQCGAIRKTPTNVSMLATWKSWGFGENMILEAANRSCLSANPIPYMNKILSDWKQANVFSPSQIPENGGTMYASNTKSGNFVSDAVKAANAKTDRERYYASLREQAQTVADKFIKTANKNARFKEVSSALSQMEISLAKAEVFNPEKLPALEKEKKSLLEERKNILSLLGIDESDLTPKYACKKCSDTGFLKSGVACDCYKK